MYILQNEKLCIKVNEFGAELVSVRNLVTGQELLWNGDPEYWKRHSPVLFPIVGSLKNGEYEFEGKTYPMSQHGFARDKAFSLVEHTEDTIWFSLAADEETKAVYPFEFHLMIGYVLKDNTVEVVWKVKNHGTDTMYFSIGAHPAFVCPLKEGQAQSEYYFGFKDIDVIQYKKINEHGLCRDEIFEYKLEDGVLPIAENLFDEDALIIEENQTGQVALLDENKKAYITVEFDAPLFGLWSPAKKNAPFVCIEPWYGRCDGENFTGTLKNRQWGQQLESKECFEKSYKVIIGLDQ